MKPQATLALLLAYASLAPALALAQPSATRERASVAASLEQEIIAAIAAAEPSVVAVARRAPQDPPIIQERLGDVFGPLRDGAATGAKSTVVAAGVIIDGAGLVLTEYLAVKEGHEHTVTTTDRKTYPATIRAADPRSGLAILAIDAKANPPAPANPGSFTAIRLVETPTLRKGQFVIAIGNPFAIETDGQPTASWGIVTNLARKAPSGTNLNDAPGPYNDYRTSINHLGTLIQTDAKLGWSAGGGALLNLRGELVGLTTTVATIAGHEQPAGYAIPTIGSFRRVIDTLKEGREVEYGMLGIGFGPSLQSVPTESHTALSVGQVYNGGPASRAGIAAGDILTRIGNRSVRNIDDVQLAISELPPASKVTIAYDREGRAATASVTLAKLAVAGKKIVTVRPEAWRGIRVDYATTLDAAQLAQAIASAAYDAEGCVLVVDVEPDSDAWREGVRPGMFINHVAGKRVSTPDEFHAATKVTGTGGAAERLDIQLTQPVK